MYPIVGMTAGIFKLRVLRDFGKGAGESFSRNKIEKFQKVCFVWLLEKLICFQDKLG